MFVESPHENPIVDGEIPIFVATSAPLGWLRLGTEWLWLHWCHRRRRAIPARVRAPLWVSMVFLWNYNELQIIRD